MSTGSWSAEAHPAGVRCPPSGARKGAARAEAFSASVTPQFPPRQRHQSKGKAEVSSVY